MDRQFTTMVNNQWTQENCISLRQDLVALMDLTTSVKYQCNLSIDLDFIFYPHIDLKLWGAAYTRVGLVVEILWYCYFHFFSASVARVWRHKNVIITIITITCDTTLSSLMM